jgi:hypothetical protein
MKTRFTKSTRIDPKSESGLNSHRPVFPSSVAGYCGGRALWRASDFVKTSPGQVAAASLTQKDADFSSEKS